MMMASGIQRVVYLGLLAILAMCVYLWIRRPARRAHVIPPGTWAIHGVAYYSLVFAGALPPELTVLLSAVLRLHSVLLIAGGLVLFIWRPKEAGH